MNSIDTHEIGPDRVNLKTKTFWASQLFFTLWPSHRELAADLIDHLYSIRAEATTNIVSEISPRAKSDQGLFESDFDLFDREHPGLQQLERFIVCCLQQTISHVNGAEVSPTQIQPVLVDSWFHITNDGGFHDAHFHGQCSWCGIYYLRVGDCSPTRQRGAPNGGNRFYSPLGHGGTYKDYGNKYLDSTYIDPPICDGMLLLFPSYLTHSALPYRGETDRVVIAFNAKAFLRQE